MEVSLFGPRYRVLEPTLSRFFDTSDTNAENRRIALKSCVIAWAWMFVASVWQQAMMVATRNSHTSKIGRLSLVVQRLKPSSHIMCLHSLPGRGERYSTAASSAWFISWSGYLETIVFDFLVNHHPQVRLSHLIHWDKIEIQTTSPSKLPILNLIVLWVRLIAMEHWDIVVQLRPALPVRVQGHHLLVPVPLESQDLQPQGWFCGRLFL